MEGFRWRSQQARAETLPVSSCPSCRGTRGAAAEARPAPRSRPVCCSWWPAARRRRGRGRGHLRGRGRLRSARRSSPQSLWLRPRGRRRRWRRGPAAMRRTAPARTADGPRRPRTPRRASRRSTGTGVTRAWRSGPPGSATAAGHWWSERCTPAASDPPPWTPPPCRFVERQPPYAPRTLRWSSLRRSRRRRGCCCGPGRLLTSTTRRPVNTVILLQVCRQSKTQNVFTGRRFTKYNTVFLILYYVFSTVFFKRMIIF